MVRTSLNHRRNCSMVAQDLESPPNRILLILLGFQLYWAYVIILWWTTILVLKKSARAYEDDARRRPFISLSINVIKKKNNKKSKKSSYHPRSSFSYLFKQYLKLNLICRKRARISLAQSPKNSTLFFILLTRFSYLLIDHYRNIAFYNPKSCILRRSFTIFKRIEWRVVYLCIRRKYDYLMWFF